MGFRIHAPHPRLVRALAGVLFTLLPHPVPPAFCRDHVRLILLPSCVGRLSRLPRSGASRPVLGAWSGPTPFPLITVLTLFLAVAKSASIRVTSLPRTFVRLLAILAQTVRPKGIGAALG